MKSQRSHHHESSIMTVPLQKDLVLLGGGHAHVHVIKMCGMAPLRQKLIAHGIQVTLISNTVLTPYSGMLPGYIASHYSWEEIHIDLSRLCRFSNVRFLHTTAVGIRQVDENSADGFVLCSDGRPPVHYNVLSLDIGITPTAVPDIFGSRQAVSTPSIITAVKPISGFADRYAQVRGRLKREAQNFTAQHPFLLAVVGGGAGN
jgi:selenide,water dikinase